ncbi:acyl-CoA dehydrogenase family protein [Enteractinococcus fodinae]|uniref:Glutaryl-CoA dehydrogenase n=1 Tax=Enteractinococcus fodinae TaxID=684663 RepID=A0ABU2AXU8_9MICC|nr:acyl-CoA dehydrogenase family protein [Enteractinococcus fodinae]MDR7346182.1 glutaryl-CoA dehydrogenase [Enteractinococcus fodinae]
MLATNELIDHPDFLLLDCELNEQEIALRDKIRTFGIEHVRPVINEHWERAEFPYEVLPAVKELGIVGSFVEGYGAPGFSRREAGLLSRELGRIDGSFCTFLGAHANLAMGSIYLLGNEEQRQRWLPDMASLDKLGAFALTEPKHGSDSVALETSARRDGDSWILNGHKRWIGNGHAADVTVLYARDETDGEVKAFVIEKEDGEFPTGYEPTVIEGKIGKRGILQADITIENVRVPDDNQLEFGQSFKDVNRVLQATRGGASWEALGHAMAAFEHAARYALNREQFGAPLAHFQLVQEKLATMLADVTTMQLLCMRLAELQTRGEDNQAIASMVKMTTSRKALAVCREARDMMGGNGLLLENHVARHLTDMEVISTYEGTDSMQALIVGRAITGTSAFTPKTR